MAAKLIFWIATGAVVYAYAGYQLMIWLLAALVGERDSHQERGGDDCGMTVSVIAAVYNEETVIQKRIENLLVLDYPRDKLEIIVASDGSDDRTVELAGEYRRQGVQVLNLKRGGKGPAQNQAVTGARGEILIFTDADTEFEPAFAREVVRCFSRNPRAGCVAGSLGWRVGSAPFSRFTGLYWKMEERLREMESAIGILAGASGAAMAVRKELWRPMADQLDDCDSVTPIDVVLQGRKVVFAKGARAYEIPFSSIKSSFRAKVRGVSKSIVMIPRRWGFANLFRHPAYTWRMCSHHFLRWMAPFFMLASFASSAFLFREGAFYQLVFWAQVCVLMLTLAGWLANQADKNVPVASQLFSLAVVNAGFAFGFLKGVTGMAQGLWNTEQ